MSERARRRRRRARRHVQRVNHHEDGCVRVWFVYETDTNGALWLGRADARDVGVEPEWLDWHICQVGLADFLGFEPHQDEDFMLAHGLAPDQPFLLEIDSPRYFRCGEWGSEWDMEVEWDLVTIAPLSPWEAQHRWAEWIRDGYPPSAPRPEWLVDAEARGSAVLP